jgi:hypothetical protein
MFVLSLIVILILYRGYMVKPLFFGNLTKDSYKFWGGSKVDVCLMSYQSILSIIINERGKWACFGSLVFVLEHSNLFMSGPTVAFILCIHLFQMGLILQITLIWANGLRSNCTLTHLYCRQPLSWTSWLPFSMGQ